LEQETDMTFSRFLTNVLKLDSASCLAMAALLVPFAAALAPLFGLDPGLLTAAGLALIPIGLFIGWLGLRGQGPAALAWLVILGNLGWTAASLALVVASPTITALGTLFTVAQALAVCGWALLEWRGVQDSPQTA
jgi:hypothetical protein